MTTERRAVQSLGFVMARSLTSFRKYNPVGLDKEKRGVILVGVYANIIRPLNLGIEAEDPRQKEMQK